MSKLDVISFKFMVGDGMFSLYKNKYYYGFGILIDGLCRFNLDDGFSKSSFNVELVVGNKCSAHNEQSAFLWHKGLGHISKERVMRLVKNEILPQLDFVDWNVCVDCIKGK